MRKLSLSSFFGLLLVIGLHGANGKGKVVAPRFEDYAVPNIYQGAVKSPDFGNRDRFEGTDLRCFGVDPAIYADEPVNFAGHYVLDACTCGSGCHYLFMWDAKSGKFYQEVPPGVIDIGPYEIGRVQQKAIEYQGESFQVDSNLLIVEGCVEDTCDCSKRYYKWTGRKFNLILRQPVHLPEKCPGKQ
jgi:hypothetical protein